MALSGDAVELNWFVASNSLGAFDMVVSEIMGFERQKVGHLKIADRYGYMPRREEIELISDIDSFKRQFTLKRNFWNCLVLAAFHSKGLTQLVYLSKWSKLLHDIMYSFRKDRSNKR